MVPYTNQQPGQMNGYTEFNGTNGHSYPSQTYPGIQQPCKPQNSYANGLQIPNQAYPNGQYGVSTVSNIQQQAMYTDSPVDTSANFPSYFTQDQQNMTNDMSGTGYGSTNAMQYQQQNGTYPAMAYLNAQHNYQYQNQ